MFKLVLACALLASACADVSHILRKQPFGSNKSFAPPVSVPVSAPIPQARSINNQQHIATLRESNDVSPDGSYNWAFEAENGIAAQEQGHVQQINQDQIEKVAQGSFSWTSPEGEQVSLTYTADGNGYQPQGSHLPVAPAIPEPIQRALAYIAAHPQQQDDAVVVNRRI